MNKFEIEPGIIASKLNIKDGDTILLTVDLDKYALDETYQCHKLICKAFPNNRVVTTFKGIEIDKFEEK